MAVEAKGRTITRIQVEALDLRPGFAPNRIATIIDEVRGAVANWTTFASDCYVGVSRTEIGAFLAKMGEDFS